jgi:hypothetical protein
LHAADREFRIGRQKLVDKLVCGNVVEDDVDSRIGLSELAKDRRHERRRKAGRDGHRQLADVDAIEIAHPVGEVGGGGEDLLGRGDRLRARVCRHQLAGGPVEQTQAERLFQLLQLQAHGRLGQSELRCRACEIPGPVNVNKNLQLTERWIHKSA